MLPQQSLSLQVAAEAIADAGWDDHGARGSAAGVFVGVGLDLNTTNFHLRWRMPEKARAWNRRLGLRLSDDELERLDRPRSARRPRPAAVGEPDDGALGGWSQAGSPASSASAGRASRSRARKHPVAQALDIAVRLLRQGELDEAIVGAVDLAGDVRACSQLIASNRSPPRGPSAPRRHADGTIPGDGAAALVLKRLDDAESATATGSTRWSGASASRPGLIRRPTWRRCGAAMPRPRSRRRVSATSKRTGAAVLTRIGARRWRWPRPKASPHAPGVVEGRRRPRGCGGGAGRSGEGRALFASAGLAAAERRRHFAIRAGRGADSSPAPYFLPRGPQFWLRDRAEGPRRAAVSGRGSAATSSTLSSKNSSPRSAITSDERRQPWARGRPPCSRSKGTTPAALAPRDRCPGTSWPRRWPTASIEALARRLVASPSERPRPAARSGGGGRRCPECSATADRDRSPQRRSEGEAPATRRRGSGHGRSGWLPHPPRARRWAVQGQGVSPSSSPAWATSSRGWAAQLSAHWPESPPAAGSARTGSCAARWPPGTFWNVDPPERFDDQRAPILGQVSLGTIVCDCSGSSGSCPRR